MIQGQMKKWISLLLAAALLFTNSFSVLATAFVEEDTIGVEENHLVTFSYDDKLLNEDYRMKEIEDDDELRKALYYSYGATGYEQQDEILDIYYNIWESTENLDRQKLAEKILSEIYNKEQSSCTVAYVESIRNLPIWEEGFFFPYYLYNDAEELIGFACSSKPKLDEQIEISELQNMELEEEAMSTEAIWEEPGFMLASSASGGNLSADKFSFNGNEGDWWATVKSAANNGENATGTCASYASSCYNAYFGCGVYSGCKQFMTALETAGFRQVGTINIEDASTSFSFREGDVLFYSDTNDYSFSGTSGICHVNFVGEGPTHFYNYGGSSGTYYTPGNGAYSKGDLISYMNNKDKATQSTSAQYVRVYRYQEDYEIQLDKASIRDILGTSVVDKDLNLQKYTVKGVRYGIYANADGTSQLGELTLKDSGVSNKIKLPSKKKYYLKEISGNTYYSLDDKVYSFVLDTNKKVLKRIDGVVPYYLYIKKKSAKDWTGDNTCYSIAGAEYVLMDSESGGNHGNFIVGYEKKTTDYGQTYQKPILRNTKKNKLVTNASGNFTYSFTYEGDSKNITKYYKNVTKKDNTYQITFTKASPIICFRGTYYLKETKPPKGYEKDTTAHKLLIKSTCTEPASAKTYTCLEEPETVNLKLQVEKCDQETNGNKPLGSATLENTIFSVKYYSGLYNNTTMEGVKAKRVWYFATDSKHVWNFQSSVALKTQEYNSDEFFLDDEGKRVLPLGTIVVEEIKPPKGYMVADTKIKSGEATYKDHKLLFQIKEEQGKVSIYDQNNKIYEVSKNVKLEFYNLVERGDVSFVKVRDDNGEVMKNVAFVLKEESTGEQHIVVTDDNGYFTSKTGGTMQIDGNSVRVSHLNKMNGNDTYLNQDKDKNVYQNKLRATGIWFYGTNDKSKWSTAVIDDNKGALPYGTYSLTELLSKENRDTQLIKGKMCTFQVAKNQSVVELALTDMPQPKLQSESKDQDTGTNYSSPDSEITITDTISYQYLERNTSYTVKNILLAREDFVTAAGVEYKAGQPIKDDNEEYIMCYKTFITPKGKDNKSIADAWGSVELTTSFAGESLRGLQAVWATYLCKSGDENLVVENDEINRDKSNVICYPISESEFCYVEHVQFDDQQEWVTMTDISTDAWNSQTKTNVVEANKETYITDAVYLQKLVEDETYTLIATLIDGESGEVIQGIDGKDCIKISDEILYKESQEGTMQVDMELPAFDSTKYQGKKVVVYEELQKDGKTYIEDKDISNERESVYFPKIATKASSEQGDKIIPVKGKITIVDTVSYEALVPGREYRLEGSLHYLDEEGKEKEMCDQQGNVITQTVQFTPKADKGEEKVAFSFERANIKGEIPSQLTVFEHLYQGDVYVCGHEDITDEDQTVQFVRIETSLLEKETGRKHLDTLNKKVSLIDEVSFCNLEPGAEYTCIGKLVSRNTKKTLTSQGKDIIGKTTFRPEASAGKINVAFTFDGGKVDDWELDLDGAVSMVAYEYLYQGSVEGNISSTDSEELNGYSLLATHTDISSVEQTVTTIEGKTTLLNKKDNKDVIKPKGKITLVDHVSAKGLIIGKKYTVTGCLYTTPDQATEEELKYKEKDANGKECVPLLDKKGNRITGTTTFVADKSDMVVDVLFTFNGNLLKGKKTSVVAFENMDETDGERNVFSHKDIEDENQTVTTPPEDKPPVETPPNEKTPPVPKTGDLAKRIMLGIMTALLSVSMSVGLYLLFQRGKGMEGFLAKH